MCRAMEGRIGICSGTLRYTGIPLYTYIYLYMFVCARDLKFSKLGVPLGVFRKRTTVTFPLVWKCPHGGLCYSARPVAQSDTSVATVSACHRLIHSLSFWRRRSMQFKGRFRVCGVDSRPWPEDLAA